MTTCRNDCKHFRDCGIDKYKDSRNAHLCPGFSKGEPEPVCQCCGREVQWVLKDAYPDPAPDYVVCTNCLTRLTMLDLTKKQFKNLIKAGHSTTEYYLHNDFYDDMGNALQPRI
jgi:hypothetical protein